MTMAQGLLNSTRTREDWDRELRRHEAELGFSEGFKPLYCPWSTLETGRIAFLSLNPGRAPDDAEMRVVSDERGNSYEVEGETTKSPLTDQFLKLCVLLGVSTGEVITGVVAPFRSGVWGDLTADQQRRSLEIGMDFWRQPLARPEVRLVLTCSAEATKTAATLLNAFPDREALAGWGNIRLKRFRSPDGRVVLGLPHLSRFRLLGRPVSEAAMLEILDCS